MFILNNTLVDLDISDNNIELFFILHVAQILFNSYLERYIFTSFLFQKNIENQIRVKTTENENENENENEINVKKND